MDFDLRLHLEEVLDLIGPSAQAKGLELTGSISPDVPLKLRGDGSRFAQALTLLASEAVRRTEAGDVAIVIGVDSVSATSVTLRIDICDTGEQIPTDRLAALMRFQADRASSVPVGLPAPELTASLRLVQMLGGNLWIENLDAGGTQCTLTVCFERQLLLAQSPTIELPGMRLLVISEQARTREAIAQQARQWQIDVVVAEDADRAMRWLRQAAGAGAPFDVAIVDLRLSVVDGRVLAQAIRLDRTLPDLQLVALTYAYLPCDTPALLDAGFNACLAKPIKHLALLQVLVEVGAKLQLHSSQPHPLSCPENGEYALDIDRLIRICEGSLSAMETMLAQFLSDSPGRIAAMRQAIADDDFFTLGQHAHFLKGSSATLGIAAIETLSEQIRQQAVAYRVQDCLALVAEIESIVWQLQEQRECLWEAIRTRVLEAAPTPTISETDFPDRTVRVLLVDDDLMTLNWLKACLQKLPHYETVEANSGEAAWQLLATQTFDVTISDWSMPDMSGVVLCQRLKFCPQLPSASAPFLLLTAHSNPEYEKIAGDAGVDDFIVKPVDPETLRAKVAFWAGASRSNCLPLAGGL